MSVKKDNAHIQLYVNWGALRSSRGKHNYVFYGQGDQSLNPLSALNLNERLGSPKSDLFQSLRKFPKLYRTVGQTESENLPDRTNFYLSDKKLTSFIVLQMYLLRINNNNIQN